MITLSIFLRSFFSCINSSCVNSPKWTAASLDFPPTSSESVTTSLREVVPYVWLACFLCG